MCRGMWVPLLYDGNIESGNSTVHIGLFYYIKVDTPISIALGYLMWHNSRLTEFCLWSLVLATYYCTSQPNNLWALFQSNQVSYNEK